MFVGIMVATQEDVDYMNGCGTLVTTSWMWLRGCHTVGLCLETLYIRGLSLYCSSSIGIHCWVLPIWCLSHGLFSLVWSSVVCTLIPCCPRLSGGLIQFLIICVQGPGGTVLLKLIWSSLTYHNFLSTFLFLCLSLFLVLRVLLMFPVSQGTF